MRNCKSCGQFIQNDRIHLGYKECTNQGIDSFFSIVNKPMELEFALNNAYDLISSSTEEIYKTLIL